MPAEWTAIGNLISQFGFPVVVVFMLATGTYIVPRYVLDQSKKDRDQERADRITAEDRTDKALDIARMSTSALERLSGR